jgi:ribosomal protein S12 methylthiotransferase
MLKTYAVISLGCSRNLVDSEVITGQLEASGLKSRDVDDGVDLCVVNTCAFIESARKESVDAIMEIASLKKDGKVRKLVVCGCLPQLYKDKLLKALPEADLVLGTSDFPNIGRLVRGMSRGRRSDVSAHPAYLYDDASPRSRLTPRHYAYVKISEGCSNLCSYCIISRLRGPFRSRRIESVVREVSELAKGGYLKEVNLVGQDTTLFGMDLYGRTALARLLAEISKLRNGVEWIRLLYTHPAHYTDDLIDIVAKEGKICKYLDLPVQHISDRILKAMNRRVTRRDITGLIEKLRARIPGLVLRTSIIVGFPGETEKEFKDLLGFVKDTGFERLGAFVYCREPGTKAARLAGQIPERVKDERLDELMRIQRGISTEFNGSFVGKTVKVLIDERQPGEPSGSGKYLGRTQGDAPEVDGNVLVSAGNVKTGRFIDVRITGALEYDLVGSPAPSSRRLTSEEGAG